MGSNEMIDWLVRALQTIAETKPHHAGQSVNEYHMRTKAETTLRGMGFPTSLMPGPVPHVLPASDPHVKSMVIPEICDGCGSTMTHAQLLEFRDLNPKLVGCCPERKMRPVTREDINLMRRKIRRIELESEKLGRWLSAALDDSKVCDEMKADITNWFNTLEQEA